MRAGRFSSFIKSERAGVTVEFVAIMPAFMLLTFFIMEITIAVLWIGTAEKAAQLGARLAVVSNTAVAGLPPNNALFDVNFAFGQSCSIGACQSFATLTCTGGTGGDCDSTNFDTIVSRMSDVFGLLRNLPQPAGDYVTIEYTYVGLGFAGGPVVPSVTVTLSGVPYGTVMTTILGSFFGGGSILEMLPVISVTLTGEDLSTAGA